MGIRIHKDMGYFLEKKDIKKVLVSNYNKIIKKYDKENLNFYNTIDEFAKNSDNMFLGRMWNCYYGDKDGWIISQLIKNIFHGDDDKGLIFFTPDIKKYSRYDDYIDYYESEGDCTFNAKVLNRPIYPLSGYILMKENEVFKEKVGEKIDQQMMSTYNYIFKENLKEDIDKYIAPIIDPMIYVILKSTGLLKEEITELELMKFVKPTIITSWN